MGINGSVDSLLETWPTWQNRILKYASMEGKNRPVLQKLLQSADSFRDQDGKLVESFVA